MRDKIKDIIVFEFRERNLKKREVTILDQKIEEIDSEREFIKIEPKLPLYDNLDSNKILLFLDFARDQVWMWCGENTTSRMKSVARTLILSIKRNYQIGFKGFPNYNDLGARDKFVIDWLKINIIDQGKEPFDFKTMLDCVKESDYQEFIVNEFLTLKLEDNKTFIYVKGEKFIQCIRLFLQIPPQKSNLYEEIESIDEATEIFDKFLLENRIVEGKFQKPIENHSYIITPEQEFWGHCSNIQAWVECEYDTRLLHSNLSFPLLKELANVGDQLALIRFKEEIAQRLEGGYFPVIVYLTKENYLRYLPPDDLYDLGKKISSSLFPKIFKLLKRESFGSYMINKNRTELRQRSRIEYSRLRRIKDLLYVPHIFNQMNPKDLVIGLASLDFIFLDFFIHPNIENRERYLEDLLEIIIKGFNSNDSVFHKATLHFIGRLRSHLSPSKERQKILIDLGIPHNQIIISIRWFLKKIEQNLPIKFS